MGIKQQTLYFLMSNILMICCTCAMIKTPYVQN